MIVNEYIAVTYEVRDEDESVIAEFDTRDKANGYIKDRDWHGYDTILWSVVPTVKYNEPAE